MLIKTIEITAPDDWHVHLRDQDYLKTTVNDSAKTFARALVMPNLKPALTTVSQLLQYRERILKALDQKSSFYPYMTFYINESLQAQELEKAKAYPFILGAKLYPAGATTNSEQGAKSIKALYPLLELMQAHNLVLQIHGESTSGDIFDRESLFLTESLKPLLLNFPRLRVVLEHISTKKAVDFVRQGPDTLAATITVHHLLYNRNHLLAGGIKPHFYCLPILKRSSDQDALQQAAVSANPKFFAGTDSAPHLQKLKENSCGCAGIYSAPYALPLYAQCFGALNRIDRLEGFVSFYGADFYQLPYNTSQIRLSQQPQHIPTSLNFADGMLVPIAAGETIEWSILDAK